MRKLRAARRAGVILSAGLAALLAGGAAVALATCGPFTDVAADSFCPFVLEIFYLGITTGTTPTTYDPTSAVSRLQMAAFLSRTVDGVLKRGSRRAALNQFWPAVSGVTNLGLGLTNLSFQGAEYVAADGLSVWVSGNFGSSVTEVLAGNGAILGTWTGATSARGVLVALGRVFVTGATAPGRLYMVNPAGPTGSVTTVSSSLGDGAQQAAFNGARILSADTGGSVSIIMPTGGLPWTVSTVTTGFTSPTGILFDGTNFWVTDSGAGKLFRVGSIGNILQTVTVETQPFQALFDGTNIWVPNTGSDSVSIVKPFNGTVLQTLTGNGLSGPRTAAFDGERVIVVNRDNTSISVFKAADLTPLATVPTGLNTSPLASCSDGINFWITLNGTGYLARF